MIGQRISNLALDVLGALVEATYARKKAEALGRANRKFDLVRWMVGGWFKRSAV